MLTESHIKLLEKRGIDPEMASNLGWKTYDKKDGRDWIEIPYPRNGEIVGRKYRTLSGEKGFFQEKGSEQCLYGLDNLIGISEDTVITICEGELDAAIAMQCGYVAVSVPNGAPSKAVDDENCKKFDYLADIPAKNTIIIATDSDDPGSILLNELAKRVGRHRCMWLKYPLGDIQDPNTGLTRKIKDLNDTFMVYGKRGVDEVFKRAEWMRLDGIYTMDEIAPAPNYPIVDCGVEGFNDYYKLRPGDLTVITGLPQHGKTMFVNEVMMNMALYSNWTICVSSFEQNTKPDHQRALQTIYLKKPARLLPDESEDLKKANAWINQHFVFIIPGDDDIADLRWLLSRIEQAIYRHGCKLVVIDPWNEMDHHRPNGMNITEYTGFAIKEIKRSAKKWQVHIIIVAHPAKMERNKEGNYPVPTLYDIADSAHWANKPDVGIVIYRNEAHVTTLKVVKCRYSGIIGMTGQISAKFDSYLGCFNTITPEEESEMIEKVKKKKAQPPKDKEGKHLRKKGWPTADKKNQVED